MARFRTPPRYDIAKSVQVYVGENKYFVFLESEIVVQEVAGRGGRTVTRRVTSRRIETSAILRACDKVNEG